MSNIDKRFDWRDGVSLKEHLESRLAAMERDAKQLKELFGTRLDNMQANVMVAKAATDEHFLNVNEWRLTVTDLISGKASATDLKKVEDDIKILRESKATLEGKASQQSVYTAQLLAMVGILFGIISILIGLVSIFR